MTDADYSDFPMIAAAVSKPARPERLELADLQRPPIQRVELGPATLYCGDCAEILQHLPEIGEPVSDPPYDFDCRGGGAFRAARTAANRIYDEGLDQGFDEEWLISTAVAKGAPSMVLFCHNDQVGRLQVRLQADFDQVVVLSWHKTNPVPFANKHYRPDTEFWLHAWKAGAAPAGTLDEKGRWFAGPVGKSLYDHPTVKPLDLMLKVVGNVSGDLICDPYMGTGSTGVAALALGKRFIGIEKDPKYFEIARNRIAGALEAGITAQSVLAFGDGHHV